jgi:hypothetical protein
MRFGIVRTPEGCAEYFGLSTEVSSDPTRRSPDGVTAGMTIAACATLMVLAIAHHPTVVAQRPAEMLADVVAVAVPDRIVHGSLIVIIGALVFGFAIFAQRQGLERSTVLGGFLAFATGAGALVGAALIDGFLVPDVALLYVGKSAETATVAVQLLSTCALMIQILTKLGLLALSGAILAWSVGLVRTSGAARIAGIIGFVAGVGPAAFLLAGRDYLTPHTLGAIVLVEAIWYLVIAALLIRRNM